MFQLFISQGCILLKKFDIEQEVNDTNVMQTMYGHKPQLSFMHTQSTFQYIVEQWSNFDIVTTVKKIIKIFIIMISFVVLLAMLSISLILCEWLANPSRRQSSHNTRSRMKKRYSLYYTPWISPYTNGVAVPAVVKKEGIIWVIIIITLMMVK